MQEIKGEIVDCEFKLIANTTIRYIRESTKNQGVRPFITPDKNPVNENSGTCLILIVETCALRLSLASLLYCSVDLLKFK